MDARGYMKWLSILCLVMALFGTAVMLVGYKVPTIGLVATVATLVIAAGALTPKPDNRSANFSKGAMGTDSHRPLSHARVL